MPHIMEYLDLVCCRMLEHGGGSWNIEQLGSELPAQPQLCILCVKSSTVLGDLLELGHVFG